MAETLTREQARLDAVLAQVREERDRQDEKWGPPEERTHLTFTDLVTILTEEAGELAEAALEHRFGSQESSLKGLYVRQEALQVAAVAVAICEHVDLRALNDGAHDD